MREETRTKHKVRPTMSSSTSACSSTVSSSSSTPSPFFALICA